MLLIRTQVLLIISAIAENMSPGVDFENVVALT